MNWLVLLLAFAVGAIAAAAAAKRFRRRAPGWRRARRVVIAAAVVPAAILVLLLIGTVWTYAALPAGGESGRDMAIFIYRLVAIVLSIPAFIGGLVGAAIVERWSGQ
jgi:heme/copper-type cytochrome/quinol oxidase subunit 2